MPETASRKLPYPSATAAPDVPTAIQQLAEKVDADVSALYADTGWIAIVPTDVRFSAGANGMAYRRRGGYVHIQMYLVTNPTNARGVIFTLPEGFRPTRTMVGTLTAGGLTTGQLLVNTDGRVRIEGSPNTASEQGGLLIFPVD